MKPARFSRTLLLSVLLVLPLSADFLLKKELSLTPLSFSLKKRPSSPSRYFFQLTNEALAKNSNSAAAAVYELHYDETLALRKIAVLEGDRAKEEKAPARLVVRLTKSGALEAVSEQLSPFLSLTLRFNFLEQIEEKIFTLGKDRLTEKYQYYVDGAAAEQLAAVAFYKNKLFLGKKKYRYLSRIETEEGTKESVEVEYYNAEETLLRRVRLEEERFGDEALRVETHYAVAPVASVEQQQKISFFSGGKLRKETVKNSVAIDYRYDAEGRLIGKVYRALNSGKVVKEYQYRYRQLPPRPTLAEFGNALRRETLESSSIEQFIQRTLGKTLAAEAIGAVVAEKELLKNFNQQLVFFSLKQYSADTDQGRWEKQIVGVSLTTLFFNKKRLVRKTLRTLRGPFETRAIPLGEYRYTYYEAGRLAGPLKEVAFYTPGANRAGSRVEYAYRPQGVATVKLSKASPAKPPRLGKSLFLSLANAAPPFIPNSLLAALSQLAREGFSKATFYQRAEEKQLVFLERVQTNQATRLVFSYYAPDRRPYYLRSTAEKKRTARPSKPPNSPLKKRLKLQARISIIHPPPPAVSKEKIKAQWEKFEPESGRRIFSLTLAGEELWAEHFSPSTLTRLLTEEKKVRLKDYQALRLFLEQHGEAL